MAAPRQRASGATWKRTSCCWIQGRIVARLDDGPEYLINTSLERYRESLTVVGEARDAFAAQDDDEATDAQVEELKAELRRIDPEALADPSSYWASMLEQIEFEQF